ncbi:hypothetical protein MJI47_29840, partial [Salmonella enterica subsp. enterica serovar Kentucky]|nr:hypothetical protein [Salmonella enterica subsp. enterica serovar Kentucky]
MKQITGVYTAPRPHWVGDGFPVRSLFSYQSHAQQLSPFLRYAAQAMQIAQQNTNAQMNILATAAGDMGNVLAGVFGEGNKA